MIQRQEYELVDLARLREHPLNPRRGDTRAIKESIKENGFYGAVVVQKRTGYILAGNHRARMAAEAGESRVPVIWLDVDDERARKILAADNRTSDDASYDNAKLADLMAQLQAAEGGLKGTGYSEDDMILLQADLEQRHAILTGGNAKLDSAFFEPEVMESGSKKKKCPTCGRQWNGQKAKGQEETDGGEGS